MEKIKFQTPDGTTEEFYVEEQTMIGGRSYLLWMMRRLHIF